MASNIKLLIDSSIGEFSCQALLNAVKQQVSQNVDPAVKSSCLLSGFGRNQSDGLTRGMHTQDKPPLIVRHRLQATFDGPAFRFLLTQTVHRRCGQRLNNASPKNQPIPLPA
jgi:hypothetical protein